MAATPATFSPPPDPTLDTLEPNPTPALLSAEEAKERLRGLVTWKQLAGDRRLADALAECDEREWDALPLAAKGLTRLIPSLWSTKKAAERWIVRNPPNACRDIIRVWGVLNDHRPPGQTSWSKGGQARGRSRCGIGEGAGGEHRRHSAAGPLRIGELTS